MSFYDEDLASVHHEGFGDFARGAAPGLLARLRAANVESGTVIDLGCGSGIWLRALADNGYAAIGVDQSSAMLDIARRIAPAADLRRAPIREFDFPPCAAVTAMGEALCYLTPDGAAPDLPALFAKIQAALQPGGLFAFDLLVEGEPMAYRSWRQGEDWAILFEVSEDVESRVLHRDQTIFRRRGERFRRSHELHRALVCSPEEVHRFLESAGFRVETRPSYGAFELPPRRLAFFATR